MARQQYQYPFGDYMQQCELNYSLLCRLVRDMAEDDSREILLEDNSIIQLQIKEQHKYTSFIQLKHIFSNKFENILDFELSIRLYHDARQAEVFSSDGRAMQAKLGYPNSGMEQTDEKFNINHFLGDLLQHCMRHGRSAEAII